MVQQSATAIENNFTKGLLTEFTGLNFPANAATDTDNCTYTLVGDVTRRLGIDYEKNFDTVSIDTVDTALSSFKWTNAGGDGNTQYIVTQVNGRLYFWKSSSATEGLPLSTQFLVSNVVLSDFVALSSTFDETLECQYASGNGYLFVFHPSCDPIYCSSVSGSDLVVGNRVNIQIRDFTGVSESGVPVNTRPTALTLEHNYNLTNQGWVSGNPWSSVSTTLITLGLGSKVFTVSAGLPVTLGDQVTVIANHATASLPVTGPMLSGNITAYAGTSMTVNVTSGATGWFGIQSNDWLIVPRNIAFISNWFSAVGNYPSNADVWWTFKNSSGVFDPATTLGNVTLGIGSAPKGHFLIDAFNQNRDVVSSIAGITKISTLRRPRTGTWFQGRVWFSGVDDQQAATGDASNYSWTENIYFSQIVRDSNNFGKCYQENDPTSETLFDLLPTDGGVIQIQGCGSIHKLFPVQNGLLVFAANGIWFITGSQGIGFSANDYTITKISSVQSISGNSFVNVLGYPFFWNEEGIYSVSPAQKGSGFSVDPITVGTIQTFYDGIPSANKKYVHGDYHPIDYCIQWVYKSRAETGINDRYRFDRILNFNTYNKAFFPYTITVTPGIINNVIYVAYPGVNSPPPAFKYLTSNPSTLEVTWSDEHDTNYVDWASSSAAGVDYTSYFITGFRLTGQALKRFQMPYLYTFSRNDEPTSFKIQGLWDYAVSGNSGRWSTAQLINNFSPNFGMIFRRHRIRGQGLVLQIKVTSVSRQPFDIMGWSMPLQVNASV